MPIRMVLMPLKNTDLPLSEIARQLNVSHIVGGSVLRVTDLLKRMGLEE